jgi:hypothetical protein
MEGQKGWGNGESITLMNTHETLMKRSSAARHNNWMHRSWQKATAWLAHAGQLMRCRVARSEALRRAWDSGGTQLGERHMECAYYLDYCRLGPNQPSRRFNCRKDGKRRTFPERSMHPISLMPVTSNGGSSEW